MKFLRSLRKRIFGHPDRPTYDFDGLTTYGKNLDFLHEPNFQESYHRGMNTGHNIRKGSSELHIEWRVHVACWAASHALHLPGDFVECGVNTGIMSLAICNYLDFNKTGRRFFLFDTYSDIPTDQMSEYEKSIGREKSNRNMYSECFELAKANFANYPRATLVRGRIPETLTNVAIDQVCYLSIDMNILYPEIEAIMHFWPRLVPNAVVVLDDYGWLGHESQKHGFDEFAASVGCRIATLPTGQGLLLKPPTNREAEVQVGHP